MSAEPRGLSSLVVLLIATLLIATSTTPSENSSTIALSAGLRGPVGPVLPGLDLDLDLRINEMSPVFVISLGLGWHGFPIPQLSVGVFDAALRVGVGTTSTSAEWPTEIDFLVGGVVNAAHIEDTSQAIGLIFGRRTRWTVFPNIVGRLSLRTRPDRKSTTTFYAAVEVGTPFGFAFPWSEINVGVAWALN